MLCEIWVDTFFGNFTNSTCKAFLIDIQQFSASERKFFVFLSTKWRRCEYDVGEHDNGAYLPNQTPLTFLHT